MLINLVIKVLFRFFIPPFFESQFDLSIVKKIKVVNALKYFVHKKSTY